MHRLSVDTQYNWSPSTLLFKTARKQNLFSSTKDIRTECYPSNWNTWLKRQDQELQHPCAHDRHHVFTQSFGMQRCPECRREQACLHGQGKDKTHYGGRRSQRPAEAVASPHPSRAAWFHQVVLPSGQDRVTNPKKPQAKISLFHKILGGSKTGVGMEGLPHGHLDSLETSCFVLTLFQLSYDSLPYILKWKAIFTWPKWIAFTRNIWKCAFSPHS